MNKKIIGLAVVGLVLIVAGAGIWWWENREIKGNPDDYIIKETPEGKIVENKKAGLTVKAPEGWGVRKVEMKEGSISLFSPEMEVEWKEEKMVLPLKNGCLIQNVIIYEKMSFEDIQTEAAYDHVILGKKLLFNEYEEIIVNNRRALKNTFDTEKVGPGIAVYIPEEKKVYVYHVFWASSDKEKCVQEFDKFLETISIR